MRVEIRVIETTGTEANSPGHGQGALGPCIRCRVIEVNTAASRPRLDIAVGRDQLPAVKDQDNDVVGGIIIQDRVVWSLAVAPLARLALRLEIHPAIRLEVVTPEGVGALGNGIVPAADVDALPLEIETGTGVDAKGRRRTIHLYTGPRVRLGS